MDFWLAFAFTYGVLIVVGIGLVWYLFFMPEEWRQKE